MTIIIEIIHNYTSIGISKYISVDYKSEFVAFSKKE